jgi:hypothetical protein
MRDRYSLRGRAATNEAIDDAYESKYVPLFPYPAW